MIPTPKKTVDIVIIGVVIVIAIALLITVSIAQRNAIQNRKKRLDKQGKAAILGYLSGRFSRQTHIEQHLLTVTDIHSDHVHFRVQGYLAEFVEHGYVRKVYVHEAHGYMYAITPLGDSELECLHDS